MNQRIHLLGASGSGTTTLGKALSSELAIPHFDTDDYYWKSTDPPFLEKREISDRICAIERDIAGLNTWILSGSLCSWGNPLLGYFTLALFLHASPLVRLNRLKDRERKRHGGRIEPGGDMHAQHTKFMTWAESYDTASAPTRSLDLHEKWMKRLACPVVRLDADRGVDALAGDVLAMPSRKR